MKTVEITMDANLKKALREIIYLYKASNIYFQVKNTTGLPDYIDTWINENEQGIKDIFKEQGTKI